MRGFQQNAGKCDEKNRALRGEFFFSVKDARGNAGKQRARRDTERARRARSVVFVGREGAPPPPRVVSSSLARRERTCGLFNFAPASARSCVMKGEVV